MPRWLLGLLVPAAVLVSFLPGAVTTATLWNEAFDDCIHGDTSDSVGEGFEGVSIRWTWTPPGWVCTYRGTVAAQRRVEVYEPVTWVAASVVSGAGELNYVEWSLVAAMVFVVIPVALAPLVGAALLRRSSWLGRSRNLWTAVLVAFVAVGLAVNVFLFVADYLYQRT